MNKDIISFKSHHYRWFRRHIISLPRDRNLKFSVYKVIGMVVNHYLIPFNELESESVSRQVTLKYTVYLLNSKYIFGSFYYRCIYESFVKKVSVMFRWYKKLLFLLTEMFLFVFPLFSLNQNKDDTFFTGTPSPIRTSCKYFNKS